MENFNRFNIIKTFDYKAFWKRPKKEIIFVKYFLI